MKYDWTKYDTTSLKVVLYGGGKISEEIIKLSDQKTKCKKFGCYGMTECNMVHNPNTNIPGSNGKLFPGVKAKVSCKSKSSSSVVPKVVWIAIHLKKFHSSRSTNTITIYLLLGSKSTRKFVNKAAGQTTRLSFYQFQGPPNIRSRPTVGNH